MKLFCIPYAGGSASIYSQWTKFFDSSTVVTPLELKGRGTRIKEGFYENFEAAVEDLYQIIQNDIEENKYCLFGHSMGGILAYELYYKIFENQKRLPEHIFFSGTTTPSNFNKKKKVYALPDEEFLKAIINYGGMPKEILENKTILDFFLPILKNDFRLIYNYQFHKKANLLQCDVSSIIGTEDTVKKENVKDFVNYTEEKCNFYEVQGNHFFIKTNKEKVIDIINAVLKNE